MIMKRLIVSVILLAFHLGSYAFDWKSQSNEDLRADMISFAGEFAETTHDRKLSEDLNRFVMCRKAESDPYRWIAETNAFVDRWLRKYPAELSTAVHAVMKDALCCCSGTIRCMRTTIVMTLPGS